VSIFMLLVEMSLADYYQLLGVPKNADDRVIKKAYRKASLKWHPDKASGDKKVAEKKFADIAKAYEVLIDKKTRKVYDEQGEEGLKQMQKNQQQGGGNPFDIFKQFGFNFGQQAQQSNNEGPSVEMELKVTLRDLYDGMSMKVLINRVVPAESSSSRTRCRTCTYKVMKMEQRQLAPGFVQQIQKEVNTDYQCCEESDTVQVEVERGMPDGAKIDYEGYGEYNPSQEAGKVIFKVSTEQDRTFTRKGDDLHAEMSISLVDALLGFEVPLQHVGGHPVTIKKTTVTHPGEVITVTGEGMPQHETPTNKGNLYVKITVVFPNKVDEAKHSQLRALLSN